jgi:hypothetical protein
MLCCVDVDELRYALGGVVLEAAYLERTLRTAFSALVGSKYAAVVDGRLTASALIEDCERLTIKNGRRRCSVNGKRSGRSCTCQPPGDDDEHSPTPGTRNQMGRDPSGDSDHHARHGGGPGGRRPARANLWFRHVMGEYRDRPMGARHRP